LLWHCQSATPDAADPQNASLRICLAWTRISIAISIIAAHTASLRIDAEMTDLAILQSRDLEVVPLRRNLYIAPPIRRHFLANLFFGDWPNTRDEDRCAAALSNDINGGDSSDEEHGCNRPHQR
jgi:hypothetical protein